MRFVVHPLLVSSTANPIPPQFSVNAARYDAVATNAVLADVKGDDLCQRTKRRLSSDVVTLAGYPSVPSSGREVEDDSGSSLQHRLLQHLTRTQHRRGHINLEVAFQFSRVCSQMYRSVPGAAALLHKTSMCPNSSTARATMAMTSSSLVTSTRIATGTLAGRGRRISYQLFAASCQQDLRAFVHEAGCHHWTETCARASDDCNFAGKPTCHRGPPERSRPMQYQRVRHR